MKLSRIKALCLENDIFEIIDGPGSVQWLGNGHHFFAVVGAKLDIDGVDQLLGVSEKKAAACQFNQYDYSTDGGFCGIWRDDEIDLQPIADVWGFGQQLLALEGPAGVLYVHYDALNALPQDARRAYRLRDTARGWFVACYHGLACEALLSPLAYDDAQKLNKALARVIAVPVLDLYGAHEG